MGGAASVAQQQVGVNYVERGIRSWQKQQDQRHSALLWGMLIIALALIGYNIVSANNIENKLFAAKRKAQRSGKNCIGCWRHGWRNESYGGFGSWTENKFVIIYKRQS